MLIYNFCFSLLLLSFLLLISLQPKQEDEDKLCELFPSKKDNVRAALEAAAGDLDRAACLLAEGKILEFITVKIFFIEGLKLVHIYNNTFLPKVMTR